MFYKTVQLHFQQQNEIEVWFFSLHLFSVSFKTNGSEQTMLNRANPLFWQSIELLRNLKKLDIYICRQFVLQLMRLWGELVKELSSNSRGYLLQNIFW